MGVSIQPPRGESLLLDKVYKSLLGFENSIQGLFLQDIIAEAGQHGSALSVIVSHQDIDIDGPMMGQVSSVLVNIATGKTSQAITSFNYMTILSFVTR